MSKTKRESKFWEIKETSQVLSNDLTNEEQRRITLRIANKRKLKEILRVSKGHGCMLKCEYVFMETDICERGGGGLQSHPRLIDDTLYRTPQNNTDMKQARELVIALSNADFKILLSCCYNYKCIYTQNYKKHHASEVTPR